MAAVTPEGLILRGVPPTAPGTTPTTETCARCGATIPRRTQLWSPCPNCRHAPRAAMHGVEPSQQAPESDWLVRRRLEGDAEAAHDAVVRHEAALRSALGGAEQALRDLRMAAARLGAAEGRLVGRDPRSVADERLAPVRRDVSAAVQRLEQVVWAAVQ